MSFSAVGGGFQGGDALLAFAAIQQGRMNEQMTDAMLVADLRSQMAGDLADIKAHLQQANQDTSKFPAVDAELQAFMAKYGDVPELQDVVSTVEGIAKEVSSRCAPPPERDAPPADHAQVNVGGPINPQLPTVNAGGPTSTVSPETAQAFREARGVVVEKFDDKLLQSWLDDISEKLDASGTNDQLAMIHIKQLNDDINNSSGMVSGIIESRQNSTASIINNIA